MSAGILVSGVPNLLQQHGLDQISSIKPLFAFYSIIGIAVTVTYFLLSREIEPKNTIKRPLTKTLSPKSKIFLENCLGYLPSTLLLVAL